ncbi:MAG: long-chain fatty acid--CoA ligase [Acidobacteria bacterium]|nr:long-chain fatty acid--CoA ligase [Acidobacteriota bacterium]
MNSGPVDAVAGHPLARTFCGPRDHVFLEDDRQTWTVNRLLSLAGDIAAATPPGPARVAVRARSAAFVVASLVGLWKSRRHPLLLDPALGDEAAGLGHLDPGTPTLVPAWEDPAAGEIAVAETGSGEFEPSLPATRDIILAFFTSGSTGEPKIVPKFDFQLQRQYDVEPAWLGLGEPIRTVSLVPSHHILGYIYGFNLPAATGGRVIFLPGSPPHTWIEAVRRERPSLVVGVPLHYRLISQALNEPLPEAVYLSSGGPLPASVSDAFRERAGWPIVQVYGSTEAGGIATRIGSGPWRPMPGVEWKAREADGLLLIRSPWQDDPAAWHRQDDVVEAAGAGFGLLGRADSVVKVGGRRFSLAEVVQAALSLPPIDQAHAVPYDRYGELAVALFVVARQPPDLTPADVRAFLATRLAPFKVPRTIRVLDELPSRGIGKVDETALRRMAALDAGRRQPGG